MKRTLLCIVAATSLAACSSPKYTYYFDQQQFNAANELSKSSEGIVKPDENSVTASSQSGLADETFASTLPSVTPVADIKSAQQPKTNIAAKHTLSEDTRSTVSVKDVKKDKKKRAIRSRKADSESSFAIAGFVCSLVSLFVLWPLSIPGVIFSALGLKSARRGLAIAGLIIGIVALVLILAAL